MSSVGHGTPQGKEDGPRKSLREGVLCGQSPWKLWWSTRFDWKVGQATQVYPEESITVAIKARYLHSAQACEEKV